MEQEHASAEANLERLRRMLEQEQTSHSLARRGYDEAVERLRIAAATLTQVSSGEPIASDCHQSIYTSAL
jgi:hypothetical protein